MTTAVKTANLKKGFSLLELIFIISVLGIIAAVAIPKLMDTKSDAVVTSIQQDITTITTSIQSYYMVNSKIDKISDAININPSKWTIEDKKLEYKANDQTCVTIEITTSNILQITINQDSSSTCQKLYQDGVRDTTYNLY